MKKLIFRFILNSKKGFRKYIKKDSLGTLRRKIFKLRNENVISSNDNFFETPKQKIFNQYLGQELLNQKFIWVYLFFYSKGSRLIYPLPRKWQKSLEKNGTRVNKTLSTILYFFFFNIFIFVRTKIFF